MTFDIATFWRAGLVNVFALPDLWSWVVAVLGFAFALVLSAMALMLGEKTHWAVHLGVFASAVAVVGIFCWVVSKGGF